MKASGLTAVAGKDGKRWLLLPPLPFPFGAAARPLAWPLASARPFAATWLLAAALPLAAFPTSTTAWHVLSALLLLPAPLLTAARLLLSWHEALPDCEYVSRSPRQYTTHLCFSLYDD